MAYSRNYTLELGQLSVRPTIRSRLPIQVVLFEDRPVTVTLDVENAAEDQIQWLYNWEPIPGATGRTYTFEDREMFRSGGQVAVQVENQVGLPYSNFISVEVSDAAFPWTFHNALGFIGNYESFDYSDFGWEYQRDLSGLGFKDDLGIKGRFVPVGETAFISMSVSPPGVLSFSWMASSSSDRSIFKFFIDETELLSLSGSTLLERAHVFIPEGSENVRWELINADGRMSERDHVWLADVQFEPATEQRGIIVDHTRGVFSRIGDPFVLSADVEPESALYRYLWYKNGTFLKLTTAPMLEFASARESDTGIYEMIVYSRKGVWTRSEKIPIFVSDAEFLDFERYLGESEVSWAPFGPRSWIPSFHKDAKNKLAITPEPLKPGEYVGLKGTVHGPSYVIITTEQLSGGGDSQVFFSRDGQGPITSNFPRIFDLRFLFTEEGEQNFYIEYLKGENEKHPDEGLWLKDVTVYRLGEGPIISEVIPKEVYLRKSGSHGFVSVRIIRTPNPFFQWYVGTTGDTSSPIEGENGQTLLLSAYAETGIEEVWVRVSNESGSADSESVKIHFFDELPQEGAEYFLEFFDFEEISEGVWESGDQGRVYWDPRESAQWVLSERHGFLFITNNIDKSSKGLWVYDTAMGYLFYHKDHLPNYFFSASLGEWIYHAPGTNDPRWFYIYSLKQWVSAK